MSAAGQVESTLLVVRKLLLSQRQSDATLQPFGWPLLATFSVFTHPHTSTTQQQRSLLSCTVCVTSHLFLSQHTPTPPTPDTLHHTSHSHVFTLTTHQRSLLSCTVCVTCARHTPPSCAQPSQPHSTTDCCTTQQTINPQQPLLPLLPLPAAAAVVTRGGVCRLLLAVGRWDRSMCWRMGVGLVATARW